MGGNPADQGQSASALLHAGFLSDATPETSDDRDLVFIYFDNVGFYGIFPHRREPGHYVIQEPSELREHDIDLHESFRRYWQATPNNFDAALDIVKTTYSTNRVFDRLTLQGFLERVASALNLGLPSIEDPTPARWIAALAELNSGWDREFDRVPS